MIVLSASRPARAAAKDLLATNETIIDPYYMKQLLVYGIKLGKDGAFDKAEPGALEKEAEVRDFLMELLKRIDDTLSGWWLN